MVVGALILLICMPFKAWLAMIGLLLVIFGFVLWRID